MERGREKRKTIEERQSLRPKKREPDEEKKQRLGWEKISVLKTEIRGGRSI